MIFHSLVLATYLLSFFFNLTLFWYEPVFNSASQCR